MSKGSAIEWTDSTWNPVRARIETPKGPELGWHCEHVSEGCRHCFAEGFNRRLGTKLPYKPGHRSDIHIFLDPKLLIEPMRWVKPQRIFVCSMTDLFADFVSDEWLDQMFAVMALCPQHQFQVLTKRADRMRRYMTAPDRKRTIAMAVLDIADLRARAAGSCKARPTLDHFSACFAGSGPFQNILFGVSVEDRPALLERAGHLRMTPAARRFFSCEPLLADLGHVVLDDIDWVICGGESGPKARPMHPDWARSLRDQCASADVPFFFKQWGEWGPHTPMAGGDLGGDVRAGRVRIVHPSGLDSVALSEVNGGRASEPGSRYMARLGKKKACRLLDGVAHDGMPT